MIYPEINLQLKAQQYLNLNPPLELVQIIAQIRLMNKNNTRIITAENVYKLNNDSYCHMCFKPNSLIHMLTDCEKFIDKRKALYLPLVDNNKLDLFEIIDNPNRIVLKKLVALFKHILHVYEL